MLEGATLGPALGHLHLLFILLRMLCPEISMTGSFCQSGLSSNAPAERPFLTTLTEVAQLIISPHYFSQLIFFVAVITVENYLIYLFIYLFVGYYPLVHLVFRCTPST